MCSYIKCKHINNWWFCCLIAATISFEQPTYTVNEADGKVEPVLVLSNPLSSVITVQVFSTDKSALGKQLANEYWMCITMEYVGGGVDYISGPYTVQFNAGVTEVPFNVALNDDSSKENNETFTLSINLSSLPNVINIGDHVQTTVTILNDDGKFSGCGTC